MNKSICGADCANCPNKKCEGCEKCKGMPYGVSCFIYSYINKYGNDAFETKKQDAIKYINSIIGNNVPAFTDLFPLEGAYIDLEYTNKWGEVFHLLDKNKIYLESQVVSDTYCLGVAIDEEGFVVSQYEENGANAKILVYKKEALF